MTTAWLIALALLDVYAIYQVVSRGVGAEGSLAWLLAIVLLPGLGSLAWIVVAGPSLQRTVRARREQTEAFRVRLPPGATRAPPGARIQAGPTAVPPEARDPDLPAGFDASILHLTTRLTRLAPTRGNHVELFDEDAFEAIEQALAAARHSIWAEYYLIRSDDTGSRFLDLLARRAADGLDVRLVYDAVGSLGIDGKRLAALRRAGGRVAGFLPVNPLRKRWALHFRNHRKLIVVDGQLAFTGGMNIGNEYSGSLGLRRRRRERLEAGVAPDLLHFRDAHLRITGPAVGDLSLTFAEDWAFATGEELVPPGSPPPMPGGSEVVAVVPSGPDEAYNSNGLVYAAGIAAARRRVWLTNAYFLPGPIMIGSLLSAAMRGVDVRVLVPAHSDVRLVQAAARFYYGLLVRGGVRLFEYQPSLLHAKTLVVDGDWSVVGSANVDVRSFRLNFELGAVVVGQDFARRMEEIFQEDLANAVEIGEAWLAGYGRWQRLRDGAARLLAPLL